MNSSIQTPTGPAPASPFHQGERAVQQAAGVREEAEKRGQHMLTANLARAQAEFFNAAPFLVTSHLDERGQPWAGLVTGKPGFLKTSPDSRLVSLQKRSATLNTEHRLAAGSALGMLALDFSSRRRNRLNTTLASANAGQWWLEIDQGYGNCPKYIVPREWEPRRFSVPGECSSGTELNPLHKRLIERSDTFFIATSSGPRPAGENTSNASAWGADISHRGGEPGFLELSGRHLRFRDYPGNNMFNTLGNLRQYAPCGLLLVDFDRGDLLQLAGRAEVDLGDAQRVTTIELGGYRHWTHSRG
jgi:predicted pyridoxine 5'-phosphate oxidase superfamily flavin-nucleotide-binding protein